jgi:hypothetical protein
MMKQNGLEQPSWPGTIAREGWAIKQTQEARFARRLRGAANSDRPARRASPFSCLSKKRGEKKDTPQLGPSGLRGRTTSDLEASRPTAVSGPARRDVVSQRASERRPCRSDPGHPPAVRQALGGTNLRLPPCKPTGKHSLQGKYAARVHRLCELKGEPPYALPRGRGIAGSGRHG